jgi:hypothetical protein
VLVKATVYVNHIVSFINKENRKQHLQPANHIVNELREDLTELQLRVQGS